MSCALLGHPLAATVLLSCLVHMWRQYVMLGGVFVAACQVSHHLPRNLYVFVSFCRFTSLTSCCSSPFDTLCCTQKVMAASLCNYHSQIVFSFLLIVAGSLQRSRSWPFKFSFANGMECPHTVVLNTGYVIFYSYYLFDLVLNESYTVSTPLDQGIFSICNLLSKLDRCMQSQIPPPSPRPCPRPGPHLHQHPAPARRLHPHHPRAPVRRPRGSYRFTACIFNNSMESSSHTLQLKPQGWAFSDELHFP